MGEEIRWVDKLYLDNEGNLHYSDNVHVDQMTQDIINKIKISAWLAQPYKKEAEHDTNKN